MSNYSTVETDKAVIRVHLTDGTMKSFLVTQSQTPNAVKFMVCKKLGLDVKEFNMFGLYVIEGDSSACTDVGENPFALHVKWNAKQNNKSKFLFKRSDETWPKPKNESSPLSPRSVSPTPSSDRQQPPPASGQMSLGSGGGLSSSNDGNDALSGGAEYQGSGDEDSYGGDHSSSRGFGFGVTAGQLEAQKNAAAAKRATGNLSAKAQSSLALIGWMNKSLEHLGLSVKNLTTDMSDGVIFFRLLELITHKTLKGWHTSPNNMMLKLDNLNMFLRILGYFGIKITGVSPEDIFSGNENIITAILLLMIKKYTPTLQLEEYTEYADMDQSQEEDLGPPQEAAPLPPVSRPMSSILPSEPASEQGASATAAFVALAGANGAAASTPPPRPSPPSDPVPMVSPEAGMTSPRSLDGSGGPRGRVRSRMVTPEEQRALAGTALIAKAPPRFAIDNSLTPDLSTLLGPPVDMPLGTNPQLLTGSMPTMPLGNAQGPILMPPNSFMLQGPTQSLQTPGTSGSGFPAATPLTKPMNLGAAQPNTAVPAGVVSPQPLLQGPLQGAPAAGTSPTTPGLAKTSPSSVKKQPVGVVSGASPKGIPVAGGPKKMLGGPPKMAPGSYKVASSTMGGPAKAGVPKLGGPVKRPMAPATTNQQPGNAVRPNSRPLPIPQPRLNEPVEEMDITFVPQDAMQDSTIPAIEMDFSVPVPGSETAARTQRTRAGTISNINTNVFDLDAFSDMEDLLLGLANNI